jgi:hypothetical protein
MNKLYLEIVLGFLLLFSAFISSLLMVSSIIEKSYFMSVIIYIFSLIGFVIGMHGVYANYFSKKR